MNRFIILVSQYNAVEYIDKCLNSILSQDYRNFEVIVTDDCSTDGTWEKLQQYPVHIIRHATRQKCGVVNAMEGIEFMPLSDNDIIVFVSGDDYLADDHVLSHLDQAYSKDIWLTYGQFVPLSGNYGPYCKPIPDTRTYRKHPDWLTSHLITFRKWLWDRIDPEDLKYQGDFTRYAFDAAFLYPMIEMAGEKHIKFIDRVLYIYNDLNPTCLFRLDPKGSIEASKYFKNKPSYTQIDGKRTF